MEASMSQNALVAAGQPVYSQTGVRLDYSGTGGEMLGKLLVGAILSVLTLGLYSPWFVVGLCKYVFSRTTIKTTASTNLKLEFNGSGGRLFVIYVVGYWLSLLTIGIYAAWLLNDAIRFFSENSTASDEQGGRWQLRYQGTGRELLGVLVVGALLTLVTLGVYTPWFLCKLQKHVLSRMEILENGAPVGRLDFVGDGGDLFVTFLVGYLLTFVTLGIYMPWFQVNIMKFNATNLRASFRGANYSGDFLGNGADLFIIDLVGMLLTALTLGIYSFWFITKTIRYQTNGHVFREVVTPA
jgi:uncharacterized membrane protein YjgN (DUF898 family)